MKKMLVVGLFLMGCGTGSEPPIEEEHAAGGGSYNGRCFVDPATGLESGACIAQTPCGCFGIGSSVSCVAGRAPGTVSLICGTAYGDKNGCKIPSWLCTGF